MQSLCPNCKTHPADTEVQYDELVASRFARTSYGYNYGHRSFGSVSQRGSATLCPACAATFERMTRLRTLGASIGNRGFLALFASVVFLAVAVGGFRLSQGMGLYIASAPLAISAVVVLVGSVLALASRVIRPSATRFLRSQPASS